MILSCSAPGKVIDASHFLKIISGDRPEISYLLAYLRRLQFEKILGNVNDPRKGTLTYSLSSILSVAFFTMLFRCGSKNAFSTETKSKKSTEATIAEYGGCPNGRLPAPKTIDDIFDRLSIDEMNGVLMDLFEEIRLSKFFSNYDKHLIPNNMYCVAIDGEVIHKYEAGGAPNCENGPYCLKRQRGDTIGYYHVNVVTSLVTPCGLNISLYVYPIHAKAMDTDLSDSKLKQECESQALPKILDALRTRFPRLNICILLDALDATGPSIQILKDHHVAFVIVRKKGNMPTVGASCDGLTKLPEYKEIVENIKNEKGDTIERHYQLFNDIYYQNYKLNLLRFEEKILNEFGKEKSLYKGEWIVSWRLKKNTCASSAKIARLRWDEEDLFNTVGSIPILWVMRLVSSILH